MNKHISIEKKRSKPSVDGDTEAKEGFFAKFVHKTLAIFLFLLLWEIAPRVGLIERIYLPPFSEAVGALVSMLMTGEAWKHISISLRRSLSGYILAAVTAIPLGVMIGWKKSFAKYVDPLLQAIRQTSALALLPVFMLFFGIREQTKILIIFWGCFWPLLINTVSGVKDTPPLLIKMARSMGASQWRLVRDIILPSASPAIITGLRLSATSSILMLTAAEMIGASAGLGWLILYSQQMFRVPHLYAAILIIAILGGGLNFILRTIEKLLLSWREEISE